MTQSLLSAPRRRRLVLRHLGDGAHGCCSRSPTSTGCCRQHLVPPRPRARPAGRHRERRRHRWRPSSRASRAAGAHGTSSASCTHAHIDHIGGFHEFERRLLHPQEREAARRIGELAPLATTTWPAELMRSARRERLRTSSHVLMDAVPFAGFDPETFRIVPAAPTHFVRGGDELDLGDRRLSVVELPGHTPGSIGLVDHEERALLSGDAIYEGGLIDTLPESDVEAYLGTMDAPARARRRRGLPRARWAVRPRPPARARRRPTSARAERAADGSRVPGLADREERDRHAGEARRLRTAPATAARAATRSREAPPGAALRRRPRRPPRPGRW